MSNYWPWEPMSDHLGAEGRHLGKDDLKPQSSFWFLGQTGGQVRRRSHLPENNLKSPGACLSVQHNLWDPHSHFKEHKSQGNHLISWRQMADRSFFFHYPKNWWLKYTWSAGQEPFSSKVLQCFLLCIRQWYTVILKHLLHYLDPRWADNLRHYLTSHKVFNISIPRTQVDCAATWGRTTRRTKLNYWQKQNRVDQQTPFLCGFLLFLFHCSSSMQHGPSFSLAPSHSLISALLLPVCTVYISFDQGVCRISMYLNVPLRSRLKLPVCQRRHSCEASPRYGRRRSGLIRIFIANEHGLALPTMRGRTKSLAKHVLSGPWCWTQQRALWSMNEVVDSMPRLPCLSGTLCHKGSLNTLSLSVVLENRLIHTKAKICLSFFLSSHKGRLF